MAEIIPVSPGMPDIGFESVTLSENQADFIRERGGEMTVFTAATVRG